MLIEDTNIYKYIKDYLDKIPVINVKKGDYVSKAFNKDSQIYYILEGKVKIESISDIGKKVLVDEISENEFTGQISYMRNTNLYCNIIAATNLKLLSIDNNILDKLMNNSEFSNVFYYKTSSRIYQMYKKMLMGNLFNQSEIVAYYILKKSNSGKFVYKSIYDICDTLNICRRSLYNILNKFQDDGIIEKEESSSFTVKDEIYLKEKADKVEMFLNNKY